MLYIVVLSCLRVTKPSQGVRLQLIPKSLRISGTRFIEFESIKSWVDIGAA